MNENNLIIHLHSWDNKILKITFHNLVQFKYQLGPCIEGLYEKKNDPSLNGELSNFYETIPEITIYYDCPLFEIIAEKVTVLKVS